MLDRILARKKQELEEARERVPLAELLKEETACPVPSFEAALTRPQDQRHRRDQVPEPQPGGVRLPPSSP